MKPALSRKGRASGIAASNLHLVGLLAATTLLSLLTFLVMWRFPASRLTVAAIGGGTVFTLLLWLFPKWQVSHLKGLNYAARFDRENEARKTLSQIFGGLVLIVGFHFSWRSLELTKRNLYDSEKSTQSNLRIASEGQITDRFTKTVAQLGDPKLEIRMGGIFALQRIASDSERDHWAVIEVLAAYIREHAPVSPTKRTLPIRHYASADIQAILFVLGERKQMYPDPVGGHLNLRGVDLRGVETPGDLSGVLLNQADLRGDILNGVVFAHADLPGALFEGASLPKADLTNAWLAAADFHMANLNGASLRGAYMWHTNLVDADLSDADLRDARDLTQSQIISAKGNARTLLPAYLNRPEHWL